MALDRVQYDDDLYTYHPVSLPTSIVLDLTTLNVVVQFLWYKCGTFRRFVQNNTKEKWCNSIAQVFYSEVDSRSLLSFALEIEYNERRDSFENCLETVLDLLPYNTCLQAKMGISGHYHIINRCDLCVPVNTTQLQIVRVRGQRLDMGSILQEVEQQRGRVCVDATHTSTVNRELDAAATRGFLIDIDDHTINRHGVIQNIVKGGVVFIPTVVIARGPKGYQFFFRTLTEPFFQLMSKNVERREPQPKDVRIMYFEKDLGGGDNAGARTPERVPVPVIIPRVQVARPPFDKLSKDEKVVIEREVTTNIVLLRDTNEGKNAEYRALTQRLNVLNGQKKNFSPLTVMRYAKSVREKTGRR